MQESITKSSEITMPSSVTLEHAVKIAIAEDRPILLDYWNSSINEGCFIGVKESGEKLLVKNEDEYTSPVNKIYQVQDEYIITTENSLYLVNKSIGTKRIE